jgi:hypothetical protein
MAANNNPTTEVLAGLVERVTFHNEDNGFCVLRVEARGKREPITVVGLILLSSCGQFFAERPDFRKSGKTCRTCVLTPEKAALGRNCASPNLLL